VPNQNSRAGHIPERSCVICKKKIDRKMLLKFFTIKNRVIFDIADKICYAKRYICHQQQCLDGLSKWMKKRKKNR